jgi:hypothetical protein
VPAAADVDRIDREVVRVQFWTEQAPLVGIDARSIVVRLGVEDALHLANELAGACWDVAVASGG